MGFQEFQGILQRRRTAGVRIDGKNTVDLKPVSGDLKLWRAEIEVEKYPMTRPKDTLKRSVMLRANVLGGKLTAL